MRVASARKEAGALLPVRPPPACALPPQAVRPDVAAQWDAVKNAPLTPQDVLVYSGARVHWRCPAGPDHAWSAVVRYRTSTRVMKKCPFCANRRLSVTNCLAEVEPLVAATFDAARNAPLTAADVVAVTTKPYYFTLAGGESVRVPVRQRLRAFRFHVARGVPPAAAATMKTPVFSHAPGQGRL